MKIYISIVLLLIVTGLKAQFLTDIIDTTGDFRKGIVYKTERYDHFKISGYMQPQFQYTNIKGAKNYSGGDFSPNVNNRFLLRRGRVRFEYAIFTHQQPTVQFAFQYEGTERGVAIRDFWGRFFENKYNCFSFTTGMFARPFGYEVNLSSADRESPERGRMSQILMRTERDLGAMISFEPRTGNHWTRHIKLDAGFFNGQGLTTTGDYDSYKDFISRLTIKPTHCSKKLVLSGGLSLLRGGFLQNTPTIYNINPTQKAFVQDSSAANLFTKAPRNYMGADMQLKYKFSANHQLELRAEYWKGTQSATATTNETPPALLTEPTYVRAFDGAFVYLLYSYNQTHQIAFKYDFYDPNTQLSGTQIGKINSNSGAADICFTTFGAGYIHYLNPNVKLVLWQEWINNEATLVSGYLTNLNNRIFTCRMQFKF